MLDVLSFCLFLLIFLLNNTNVYAQVINEVFPDPSGRDTEGEWIEIYNPEDTGIELSGYLLEDVAGHQFLIDEITIGMQTLIRSKEFLIISVGSELSLNNDKETIYLYKSTDDDELVDEFSYVGSQIDRSWGRVPDGSNICMSTLDPSPGENNNFPPTPTPSNTPTPTKTPKPTKIPTPTITQIPSPTPTIKTSIYTGKETPVPTEEFEDESSNEKSNSEERVLGIREEFENDEEDNSFSMENEIGEKLPVGALAIILGGVGFVGVGGYPYIKKWLESKNDFGNKEKRDEKINL